MHDRPRNTGSAGYFTNATTTFRLWRLRQLTGHGNTGYAGYFINTDTSTKRITASMATSPAHHHVGKAIIQTGVYGEGDCANCVGVSQASGQSKRVCYGGIGHWQFWLRRICKAYQGPTATPAPTGYGVYGTITGHGNTGYAGYFINTDTSSNSN